MSNWPVVATESGNQGMDQWLIGAITFVATIIFYAITGTWALGKMRDALRDHADERQREVLKRFDEERRFGSETILALREKINAVELQTAKTFNDYIHRDSFNQAMSGLQAQLQSGDRAADERAGRLETKIDKLSELFAASRK